MLYEYSNNPLAWNYYNWTYLLFAYFALVDKAACLLLSNAVKMYDLFMILSWKLFLVTDETARVTIVFNNNVSTICFKVLQKLYDLPDRGSHI